MDLFDKLANGFTLKELGILCFRLGIDPERDIEERDTTRTFAIALIRHCEQRERLADLEAMVAAMLSDASQHTPTGRWEEQPGLGGQQTGDITAQGPVHVGPVYQMAPPAPTPPPPRLPPPELPKYVLPRDEEVAALRALLLAEQSATVGIVGAQPARRTDERVVGVRGMGGLGKTVLATVLAHDESLRAHFIDGIFWLTLGEGASEASLLTHQTTLARALGDSSAAFTDLRAGKVRLRDLLAERCYLLILDDVWQSKAAEPFKVLGPRGRLLLTTRDAQVLNQLDAQPYDLALLGEAQALGLLAWWAKQEPDDPLPPEAPAIAEECGYLPLALAMVGALIGDEVDSWESALQKLRARDLKAVAREVGEDYAYPSLWRAIEVSVEALPADLRDRYADFALFPADTPIPPAVLHTLWEHEGLPSHRVTNALNILANRSLLRKDDAGRYTLHDLQLDFVREQAADLPTLHQRLLDAYIVQCPDGWAGGPDDGYFFQQLPYHLLEAGRGTELENLLLDYRWLRARLHATDIFTLLGDFEQLPFPLPRYHRTDFPTPGSPTHALSALQASLRKSAHVLARDNIQLPTQLRGRLLGESLPPLHPLLDQSRQDSNPSPWLSPLTASLEAPGGSLLLTLTGHTRRVNAVALSGDGRLAVSASYDGTLKVWDIATGRERQTLTGHTRQVNAVALSGDGRLALSASYDGTLKVWDIATGRERHTLTGHRGRVLGVALSGDGQLAVSASQDRTLKVWDIATGRERHTLTGHMGEVYAVALNGDGQLAVSASEDRTLKVWEVGTGRELRTLLGHKGEGNAVALNGDGRLAVSASDDGTLKVWDIATGRERQILTGHRGRVLGVALSGDGQLAVSASGDRTLKVWDIATGRERHTLTGHTGEVYAVAQSRDGRLAVSASDDCTLKVWDIATGHERHTLTGHRGWVLGVALSEDGKLAVSASRDRTLKVWDIAPWRERHTLTRHTFGVLGVALSEDGRLAVSASDDCTLKVWDMATGRERHTLTGHTSAVNAVALNGDGQLAVSASDDCTLKLWDMATGREWHTLMGHIGGVLGVALSEDGRLAVSASADHTLKVWDMTKGYERHTLKGHTGWAQGVALSEDGWLAVSACRDRTLKVWDIATGRERHTLTGHTGFVLGVSLSRNGQLAVSASDDRTLKLWDVESGACLTTFEAEEVLYCCAFAPPYIVAGGQSGRVHFLRLMNYGA